MRPLDPLKREEIIQAVYTLSGRQGLTGISILAICKETGLSVGTMYTYFKNKEEVIQAAYAEVLDQSVIEIYKNLDLELPIRYSVKSLYFNILEYRLRHYNETVFADQYLRSHYLQLNYSEQLKRFEMQNLRMFSLINRGIEEGIFRKTDVSIIISFIYGVIESLANAVIQNYLPMKKQVVEENFQMLWRGISG